MKRVPIAELCSINPRLSASIASQKDRDVDFIPMANLGEDGRISLNGTKKLGAVLKGYTNFQNGDVIVAKITPCLENGKAAYVHNLSQEIGFGSTEFHVLRPNDNLEPRFLFHMVWTPFFRHEAARNMTGTAGQQRVPASFFARFEIPLPSLSDQKRIADILDKADAIRRKRREATEDVELLLDAVFYQLFGDVPARRSSYPIAPLKSLLVAANGKSSRNVLSDEQTGIPVYGGNGKMGWATHSLYEQPVIVVGRVGQQCGITHLTEGPSWVTDNAIAVQVTDPDRLNLEFLEAALHRSTLGHDVRYIDLPYINQSMIRDLPLPLPPIEQQLQFVRRKHKILLALESERRHLDDSNGLFNSLVQRAFRGEL